MSLSYFYGSQIVPIKQVHVDIGKERFHYWQYIVFYAHFIYKSVFYNYLIGVYRDPSNAVVCF